MTKRKNKILFFVILAILLLTVRNYYKCNFTGRRSGTVVDAVTGQPIEGAVVCMQWFGGGFLSVVAERGVGFYETKTDGNGRYKVPNMRLYKWSWIPKANREDVLVYKDGYSEYDVFREYDTAVGRSFASGTPRYPYRKRGNLVRLYRFNESDSHKKHYDWIITIFDIYNWPEQLLEKELQKEMERADKE